MPHKGKPRKMSEQMSISCGFDKLSVRARLPGCHADQACEFNHGKKLPAK
jgi:hypothetical protein